MRLWHRDLIKAGENNPAEFDLPRLSRDGTRPIASERWVFASLENRLVALDAKSGEIDVDYADVRFPRGFLFDGRRVIAADENSVRAFDAATGGEAWNVAVSEPQHVIGDGRVVSLTHGRVKRGEKPEAVVLDAETGETKWARDYPWLIRTTRTVLAKGQLVFEVSTMNDHDQGNGIHVVSAATGDHLWSKAYPPAMSHARQARALFLEDDLWILHGGRTNTEDKENMVRNQPKISALDPLTGAVRVTHPAGLAHCFPPVCHAQLHVRR